jgi:hypothetical protein
MAKRLDRLKKLVRVQEQLKTLHEIRHAGFVADALAAEAEGRSLIESFNAPDSLSGLFPDLYHRRIADADVRRQANLDSARSEAGLVMKATARGNMVERAYREEQRSDERQESDHERLELITQKRDAGQES